MLMIAFEYFYLLLIFDIFLNIVGMNYYFFDSVCLKY